jgi:hypothetical protein
MAESNRLVAGEVGPCLDGAQGIEDQKELIESLKGEVVESLLFERVVKAHMA